VGSMLAVRHDFAASSVPARRVLFSGGVDGDGNTLATTEIFNPPHGTSAPGAGTARVPRPALPVNVGAASPHSVGR
jgi:hypothetical protein